MEQGSRISHLLLFIGSYILLLTVELVTFIKRTSTTDYAEFITSANVRLRNVINSSIHSKEARFRNMKAGIAVTLCAI
jgi:hypothetical protein